jgi:hypothetical protein
MPKCKKCNKTKAFYNLVNGVCENCLVPNKRIEKIVKMEKNLQKVIVRNYRGTQSDATRNFKRDSVIMAEKGYYPTSQNWSPGSYGCGSFTLALLLCIILIGILVFIYMLIVKPDGTLSVTYELKKENNQIVEKKIENLKEKECPECAEMVKEKAKICRFCRHEFIN